MHAYDLRAHILRSPQHHSSKWTCMLLPPKQSSSVVWLLRGKLQWALACRPIREVQHVGECVNNGTALLDCWTHTTLLPRCHRRAALLPLEQGMRLSHIFHSNVVVVLLSICLFVVFVSFYQLFCLRRAARSRDGAISHQFPPFGASGELWFPPGRVVGPRAT